MLFITKYILPLFMGFVSLTAFSQDTLSYAQLQEAELAKRFKQEQEFKVYLSKDGLLYKIGDTLTVGRPGTKTIQNQSILGVGKTGSTFSSNIFSSVYAGKWHPGTLKVIEPLSEGAKGFKLVISKIQVYTLKINKETTGSYNYFTLNPIDKKSIDFTVIFIDKAIEAGEIIEPRRAMTKEEAIGKLKEAKELFDLEVISKESYDSLKHKLSPIILKN